MPNAWIIWLGGWFPGHHHSHQLLFFFRNCRITVVCLRNQLYSPLPSDHPWPQWRCGPTPTCSFGERATAAVSFVRWSVGEVLSDGLSETVTDCHLIAQETMVTMLGISRLMPSLSTAAPGRAPSQDWSVCADDGHLCVSDRYAVQTVHDTVP